VIKEWLNKLLEARLVIALLGFMKRVHPWGFEGLSLYEVAKYFVEGIQKGALTTRAAAISFRIFVAIFPMLIVIISVIPLIPIDNFQELLFTNIKGFFPGDTFSLVEETVSSLLTKKQTSVLTFSFILVLYYASNSVNAILQGFNGSYNLDKRGNPLVLRIASMILMLVLSLLMVVAVALIVFSGYLFEYLLKIEWIPSRGIVSLLEIARWLVTVFLIYMSISTLYNAGDLKRKRWKIFSAGASFATLFFILASVGFAWFVTNIAQFDALYGTLGTLLILLLWMNFNSMILLLGFELNTSIAKAKDQLNVN